MADKKHQDKIEYYAGLYEDIRKAVGDSHVAIALVQEIAKDMRMEQIRAERSGGGSQAQEGGDGPQDQPATVKQITYLKSLGVRVPDNLTKRQASAMIEEMLSKESE